MQQHRAMRHMRASGRALMLMRTKFCRACGFAAAFGRPCRRPDAAPAAAAEPAVRPARKPGPASSGSAASSASRRARRASLFPEHGRPRSFSLHTFRIDQGLMLFRHLNNNANTSRKMLAASCAS